MSEESIDAQITLIIAEVCPNSPDPAGCETGIIAHWGDIGRFHVISY